MQTLKNMKDERKKALQTLEKYLKINYSLLIWQFKMFTMLIKDARDGNKRARDNQSF